MAYNWVIGLDNDDCKYRKKGNERYICEHKGNPILTCSKKFCPLKI